MINVKMNVRKENEHLFLPINKFQLLQMLLHSSKPFVGLPILVHQFRTVNDVSQFFY